MTNIHSYKELLEEKQRLTLLLAERKVLVKAEFEDIKEKLKPVTAAWEWVHKLTSKDKSNPLVTAGIDIGVNLLLKKVVLRNAGFIMKLVMPFIVKNFLSHEVAEDENLFTKIKGLFKGGNFFTNLKKQFTPHQPA